MKRDAELFAKYPAIFQNAGQDCTKSCMAFGCECGDGWYDLLDGLCGSIQSHCDASGCAQVVADQVKEKWGGLVFYFSGGDDAIRELVGDAESKSFKICEECGQPGTRSGKGWVYTACDNCRQKRQ